MWATATDVLDRWIGDDAPTDTDLVGRWVSDAEVVVAATFPGLADRVDDDVDLLERVKIVVARMVIRAFRNPSGLKSFTEQTGPFGQGGTFTSQQLPGFIVTDEDRELLGGLSGGRRQRAFTIDTTPPAPTVTTTPWWVTE